MALIRKVACNENSRAWAYIEYSDENPAQTLKILGDREFSTKEEAEDWSKGFAIDSYDHIEPLELKRNRLLDEKEQIEKRLKEISNELFNGIFNDMK